MEISTKSIGRPSVITPDTVAKLIGVLQRGISITKACVYAHIDRASFYRKYHEDEEFRNRIDDARNFATVVAAEVVVDDILKNKNVQTAKWYLERKDPEEFGTKPQVAITNQQQNQFYSLKIEEFEPLMKELKATGAPIDDPVKLFEWCEGSQET